MIVDRAQLEAQKMGQLKHLILGMGGTPSPVAETKESLINRILLHAATEPNQGDAMPEPIKIECTLEDVLKAVNPYILRGMKVFHNPDDKTWLFRVQIKSVRVRDSLNGETRQVERWRDDSGTLLQPLASIKRCATMLMQNVTYADVASDRIFNPHDNYQSVA